MAYSGCAYMIGYGVKVTSPGSGKGLLIHAATRGCRIERPVLSRVGRGVGVLFGCRRGLEGVGVSLPSAGWFPDPQGGSGQRFWDGQGWTGQVRQAPSETSSPPPEPEPVPVLVAPPGPVSGGGVRSGSGGRWLWVAGIVVVAVVAAAGGWWAASSGPSEPSTAAPVEADEGEPGDVGPGASSDPAGTDGTTAPPEQPPVTDARQWQRIAHDETVFGGDGGQEMWSVAVGGPGLVAVGRDGGRGAAAVWTSTDGIVWRCLAHEEAVFGGAEQVMLSVAIGGPGLVAVGIDRGRDAAAVWASP